MPPTAPSPPAPVNGSPSAPGERDRIHLAVSGMSCAGCAASVQQAIEAAPGVASATVSLSDGTATVTGSGVEAADIIGLIEGRGFTAEPMDGQAAPADLRSAIELRQARSERQWRRRALIGVGIWIPMAVIHWGLAGPESAWAPWVMLVGATVVLLTVGAGFYRSALRAARARTTNMDTLIAIGATAAYVFSLVVFIGRLLGASIEQPLYFVEAAALLGIISLGHWLEARASAMAGSAVRDLLELQPDDALRLDAGGGTSRVRSADIQPDDRILIRPGDRVPVDGVVVEGDSDLDESLVTGESMPVAKRPGDAVVAGSLNTTGRLVVRSSVDGRHTTVSRIAELVQLAQSSKAHVQRLADRVCAVFVPSVLVIAALTMLGWSIAGEPGRGVIATVAVLIISCPCALGLATPMAVMVGTGSASRKGILVKSAAALERAGCARQVVFDKTGTLTRGEAAMAGIHRLDAGEGPNEGPDERESDDDVIRLAASVEAVSEHPIARAIVRAASERGLDLRPVADFRALPGSGVRGVVDGRTVEVVRDAGTTCRVIVDGVALVALTIEDRPRADAAAAVHALRAMGLGVRMLSGDRREAALAVGAELGLGPEEVHAEATPESKLALVESLGAGAVMVGDGINDAAALARADLGIAMASGTNIAIESADIVIPGHHVGAVPETIRLARLTLRTIKQNLFFAFIYNGLMIPAAAFGLLGMQGPLIAAAAMGLSDITVIGNALRLKRRLR